MTNDSKPMDCALFEELVHELDRPGTRGAEVREAALVHAELCGHCAALLTEAESLDFALLQIADEAGRSVPSSRMEAAVLQEFRRVNAVSSRRRMLRRAGIIGVAAALFLALGLSLRHGIVPPSGLATGTQAGLSAPKSVPAGPAADETRNLSASAAATQAVSSDEADQDAADALDAAETAQDFTPLPYADDPSLAEGGAIVRVVLSRSALASFGVSLPDAESADQIPADLVVSADGTPEAIRLVSQNVN